MMVEWHAWGTLGSSRNSHCYNFDNSLSSCETRKPLANKQQENLIKLTGNESVPKIVENNTVN